MGRRRYRKLQISEGQAKYLEDLITFDLEDSDITATERQQGSVILNRLQEIKRTWEN